MANENNGNNNFAMLAMVAIVAVVGVFGLVFMNSGNDMGTIVQPPEQQQASSQTTDSGEQMSGEAIEAGYEAAKKVNSDDSGNLAGQASGSYSCWDACSDHAGGARYSCTKTCQSLRVVIRK